MNIIKIKWPPWWNKKYPPWETIEKSGRTFESNESLIEKYGINMEGIWKFNSK